MLLPLYSCFARHTSVQIGQLEFDLKRNSPGRTRIYEYTPTPPTHTINVRISALLNIVIVSLAKGYYLEDNMKSSCNPSRNVSNFVCCLI